MKVDIRGHRITDPAELLLPDAQEGVLPALDIADLDEEDDDINAWIPNGRQLKLRKENESDELTTEPFSNDDTMI
jgi:hypothetical protein